MLWCWVQTFPARVVGVWNWMLKNAIFENNGRRLNQMRYSSMNDWIAPGMWSPFVPTIIPSYHTSHRYWWKIIIIMVCFYSNPLPKKIHRGGVLKHTPPLKIFNIFDRSYRNHILGIRFWPSWPSNDWHEKKIVGGFFSKLAFTLFDKPFIDFLEKPQQNLLLPINFWSGRQKLWNLVYSYNMTDQKCCYFLG